MSRVGQKPVEIPGGVEVRVEGGRVRAKGPQGELAVALPAGIAARVEDGRVIVSRGDDSRRSRSLHGLARSLVGNMVRGVLEGYRKQLLIEGVGFRAATNGETLTIQLGFSRPVEVTVPAGIKISVGQGGAQITVSGADKQLVGDVAARIRAYFPAEPYKGKGLRFEGEHVRRKVGKTVA